VKSGRLRWAGYLARMRRQEVFRDCHSGNLLEDVQLKLDKEMKINIKMGFSDIAVRLGSRWNWLRRALVIAMLNLQVS
jgi:hypothetical protein